MASAAQRFRRATGTLTKPFIAGHHGAQRTCASKIQNRSAQKQTALEVLFRAVIRWSQNWSGRVRKSSELEITLMLGR